MQTSVPPLSVTCLLLRVIVSSARSTRERVPRRSVSWVQHSDRTPDVKDAANLGAVRSPRNVAPKVAISR